MERLPIPGGEPGVRQAHRDAGPVGKTATELLGTPNPGWAEIYGRVADTGEPVRLEEREPTLDRVFDLYIFRLGGVSRTRNRLPRAAAGSPLAGRRTGAPRSFNWRPA